MSLARLHCRNSLQRSRTERLATFVPEGRGRAPGVLRHLLPSCCSNTRRTSSVRLCECGPRMAAHVKSMGKDRPSPIPAKIAASRGLCGLLLADVSKVTPRTGASSLTGSCVCQNRAETSHHSRASAQSSSQQACIRAEARRGHFPPPSSLHHQTGPPVRDGRKSPHPPFGHLLPCFAREKAEKP